jgi:crotonobetainyl-CoA:carnitine CoA-transferase CaiB-like acyl-CoA transferase
MLGPLASLKVLDFSTLLPGPFASLLLADMGAEVLRIESPTRLDLLRVLPPHDQGVSASHAYLNRNKRSLALDLKQPAALEIIKQLLQDYDIVLEQFRPGVMERLGLGYEALKAINPKLIYVSITGPYRDRAGHDINYLALAGLASYTGRADSGPLPLGMQVADVAGGSLHGVIGLLAAVIARQHTGMGQHLDVSMTDCAFSLNAMAGAGYLACGEEPGREDQVLNGGSFYDYYRSRDGRWLSVGSLEPDFMKQLCTALGVEELAALGLSPQPAQRKKLKDALQTEFEKHDFAELCALFAELDACVEPVLTLSEAVQHPQLRARELVTDVPRGDGSSQAQMACPMKFSEGLPAPRHIGAALGEHTDQVLGELGFGAQRIEELRRAKVIL